MHEHFKHHFSDKAPTEYDYSHWGQQTDVTIRTYGHSCQPIDPADIELTPPFSRTDMQLIELYIESTDITGPCGIARHTFYFGFCPICRRQYVFPVTIEPRQYDPIQLWKRRGTFTDWFADMWRKVFLGTIQNPPRQDSPNSAPKFSVRKPAGFLPPARS